MKKYSIIPPILLCLEIIFMWSTLFSRIFENIREKILSWRFIEISHLHLKTILYSIEFHYALWIGLIWFLKWFHTLILLSKNLNLIYQIYIFITLKKRNMSQRHKKDTLTHTHGSWIKFKEYQIIISFINNYKHSDLWAIFLIPFYLGY